MNKVLPVRELYCPSHFGNSYEVALNNEMREILSEAKSWGFNRFSDWFDTIDLYDVYHKKHNLFNMPEAMWERKFQNYQIAAELDYELNLVVAPNHVFSNQVTKEREAVKSDVFFGQLVCPSRPGVTEMILDNYRNLFSGFAGRGLNLAAISAGAYDYGGCACDRCQPWIITFGRLVRQITELGREFFPEMAVDLIGWWWSDDDHKKFSAWADKKAPGFFNSLSFHLPYGAAEYKLRPIPKGCKERAFVHISYSEKNSSDAYGHYGALIAPQRLEKTVAFLKNRKVEGFIAYSEGAYEEINKALLGGLSSGLFDSADAVLAEYAKKHLGEDAQGWVAWLRSMGDYFSIDVVRTRRNFDRLKKKARPSWRLEQLEGRLVMAEADAEVRRHKKWNAARLKAAQRFWDAKEYLYRYVWRLGLSRHVFKFDSYAPIWHEEFLAARGKKILPHKRMNKKNSSASDRLP